MIWTNSNVLSVAKFAFLEVTPIHMPNQQMAIRFAARVRPDAAAVTIEISNAALDVGVPPNGCRVICVLTFVPLIVVTVITPLDTVVVVTTFVPFTLLVILDVLVAVIAVRLIRP